MLLADTSYRTSAIPRLRQTYYAIFLATPSLLSATPPQPHLSRRDTLPVSPLPSPEKKRPATHSGAGRIIVNRLQHTDTVNRTRRTDIVLRGTDYFIASRFTSFFAFAAREESLAIALFNWLLASLRLPSFAAMTARR